MTEVRDDLDNFINSNNILIFTCYRVNGVHLLTHPYPIYTSNMIQPIILPFEKGILIYEGTCVVSYILKNQLHNNINWDSIRNIVYNKLFYILDYSTNYMNQYNFNYRYNFNEKDYDRIINLAEDTFTFNTFLMKSGKFNYQTCYVSDLIDIIKKNDNLELTQFNYQDTSFLSTIITYNIYLLNLINNNNTIACDLTKINKTIRLSIILNNETIKDHEYLKNKLMIDYFVELYTGSINKHNQNTIQIQLFIPIIPKIFESTESLDKLKDKYIIFISNNIRIDVSLNNILNQHNMDFRIYNYHNFCLNCDHVSLDEKLILDFINKNTSNNTIHIDNSLQSLYDSSNSLILSNNYSKRKPDLVVFIVTNPLQRLFIDECKKIIDKQWVSINYLCLYDYEPFYSVPNCKCLQIPIESDILYNIINQPHGIMRLIGYKLKKQKFDSEKITVKLPNTLVLIDINGLNSLIYKYLTTLIKIPITIINNTHDLAVTCKYNNNNICIIIDENIGHVLISSICSFIESIDPKIKIAIVIETAVNINNYIHTNIKYHIVKPFNTDTLSDLLNNLNSI